MTPHLVRDNKDIALTSINNYHRSRHGMTRGDAGMDAESMRRGRYGIFFGGKNSSNKFEIKIVGKKGISVVPLQKASQRPLRPLCELTK